MHGYETICIVKNNTALIIVNITINYNNRVALIQFQHVLSKCSLQYIILYIATCSTGSMYIAIII